MARLLTFSCILAIFASAYASSCVNPQVTSKSFTTGDATIVVNIAYISEFTVKCGSGDLTSLHAEYEGNIVPVSIVGTNKYQVSWTEDTKVAKTGDRVIRIFDEEGYQALRKAVRAGESTTNVPSLFNVVVNHSGAYNGPWLQGESIALVAAGIAAYFAVVYKSQITA